MRNQDEDLVQSDEIQSSVNQSIRTRSTQDYLQSVLGLQSIVVPEFQSEANSEATHRAADHLGTDHPGPDQEAHSEMNSVAHQEMHSAQQRPSLSSFQVILQGDSKLNFLSLISRPEESLRHPDNQELLVKMAVAMGIPSDQINLSEGALSLSDSVSESMPEPLSERELHDYLVNDPSHFGVLFISDPARVPQLLGQFGVKERVAGKPWLATMHPSRLVAEPQHKRMVWEHLQMMMQEMKGQR